MYNAQEYLQAKREFNHAHSKLYKIEKEWETRAREICRLYHNLDENKYSKVISADSIYTNYNTESNMVRFSAVDYEGDEIAAYNIDYDTFVSDDYEKLITEEFQRQQAINLQKEKEKTILAQKTLEEKERAEYERLKAKFEPDNETDYNER